MTLKEAALYLGLSERWIRHLTTHHGLPVRKVPCPGGGRYEFTQADLERLWSIHQDNQQYLERYRPNLYRSNRKGRN